jgi:hypothetical protein
MTLLDTERLVRGITGLPPGPANPSAASKLAEEFADVCHAASVRLHQCEAMIKAGDRHQAIQAAETAPNLLDWVTVLEFQGADEWRRYCQEHGLPVAETIDGRCVECLNDCYAQGIATDHPLYAAYRQACLRRNDEDALQALRTITRLNPTDTNAASELTRLDAKVLAARLQHLTDLVDGAGPEAVLAQVEAIEAFDFKTSPLGDTWSRAQTIRCGFLIEDIEELKNAFCWVDALAKLDLIHRLQAEAKVQLTNDQFQRLQAVESWALAQQEQDRKGKELESLVSELHAHLQQSDDDGAASGRRPGLPELNTARDELNDVWSRLQRLGSPIPDSAALGFRQRIAALESQITLLTRLQRLRIAAGAVSVLAAVGLAAWFFFARSGARDLGGKMKAAIAARQVHKVETLLALAKKSPYKPSLLPAVSFLKKEGSLLQDFQKSLSALPAKFPSEPQVKELVEIKDGLATARDQFQLLASDFQKENEAKLLDFEYRWEGFLSKSRTTTTAHVEDSVTKAEKGCEGLDFRLPPDQVKTQLLALASQVVTLTQFENQFTNLMSLDEDLLRRLRAVRQKYTTFDRESTKLEGALADLSKASTFTNYFDAIDTLTSSQFSAAVAEAARSIQELNPTPEKTLRPLLCGENPRVWNYFVSLAGGAQEDFVPKSVLPEEMNLYQQLKNDPNVSAEHHRYWFALELGGQKPVEWITRGKMMTSGKGYTMIWAYNVNSLPSEARFELARYGFFAPDYVLSEEQHMYDFKELRECDETKPFTSLGLHSVLLSKDGERWVIPLLRSLDSLNQSREGSSLFRAYLFLRLVELMELQPEESGLWFSPAAREHKASLLESGAGSIKSGDWFAPLRVEKLSPKLDDFFKSTQPVSYWTQAAAIACATRKAFNSGFTYAGCLSPAGRLVVTLESAPAELWGYSAAAKSPALLYLLQNGQLTQVEKGMALSPLFTLKEPRSSILANAGIDPKAPLFDKQLPPLFTSARRPE